MGDMSTEPSMEEILSSIKRIIAEEGEAPAKPRRAGGATPAPAPMPRPLAGPAFQPPADGGEEVLELSQPIDPPRAVPSPEPADAAPQRATGHAQPAEPPRAAEPLVSRAAAAASRDSIDSLARLMVKPEPGSDGTLESLVRELLRPMLRDWLDARLPAMVEEMVGREIARITGQGR